MDAVSRLAGSEIPAMQKGFIRNVIVAMITAGALLKKGSSFHIKKKNIGWFLLRAVFGVVVSFGNIYAVDHMIVADSTMINKLSPLFVLIFSYLILKEKMSGVHIGVIIVGFVGALFVIKPSGDFSAVLPALVALAAAVSLGISYPIIRKLTQDGEDASVIIFYLTCFCSLFSLPFYLRDHVRMSLFQFVMVALSAVFNCLAQHAAAKGYTICPGREISVYDYSQILFAAILGLIFFGQIPDYLSFIGYAIIIGSSVYLYFYEKRRGGETEQAVKSGSISE